jgi:hypothetical protein
MPDGGIGGCEWEVDVTTGDMLTKEDATVNDSPNSARRVEDRSSERGRGEPGTDLGREALGWSTLRLACSISLLCACSQRTASAEQPPTVSREPASAEQASKPEISNSRDEPEGKEMDLDLRRGYGVVDMRFNACVKRVNDHTVSGSECPAGFLVYGPYVSVPADSEIDVSFEVKPSKSISIHADIVSQMGGQTLAGLNRLRIQAGQMQKLGYRVHIFDADVNVESRIGIDGEPGTAFEITNLTMTVR